MYFGCVSHLPVALVAGLLHILPVEVDVVDVGFERHVESECVHVDIALSDVVQLPGDACKHKKREG